MARSGQELPLSCVQQVAGVSLLLPSLSPTDWLSCTHRHNTCQLIFLALTWTRTLSLVLASSDVEISSLIGHNNNFTDFILHLNI